MSSPQTKNPQQACEAILIEGKCYNIEHGILPSENAVADRLLARGVELRRPTASCTKSCNRVRRHSRSSWTFC